MYTYIKALHIIFVVTWFAGLFYFPRLFIYNTEANDQPVAVKEALQTQFRIMMKRLWYGITWPSAILTLICNHFPEGSKSILSQPPLYITVNPKIKVRIAEGQVIPYHSLFIIILNCACKASFTATG